MISVHTDFANRVQEIELYFSFMEKVMLENAQLSYSDGSTEIFTPDINKIFRANSFLLLYNLAESCMTNAIEAIYISMDNERVSYDDLKEGIRKEIIKFLKQNVNVNDFVASISNIGSEIILKCFESTKLLSGSLDAKKVRDLASKYGFDCTLSPFTKPDGTLSHIDSDNLLLVKRQRNHLAHGIYSFKECGKNYTIQDIIRIKNDVIEYLRQTLIHIENFITTKSYLIVITP